jgi:hypothetical protein
MPLAMTGQVTLNGIDDKQLAEVLEIKAKNPGKFGFNPQTLQATNTQGGAAYNGATFTWSNREAFEIVQDIVNRLLPK